MYGEVVHVWLWEASIKNNMRVRPRFGYRYVEEEVSKNSHFRCNTPREKSTLEPPAIFGCILAIFCDFAAPRNPQIHKYIAFL